MTKHVWFTLAMIALLAGCQSSDLGTGDPVFSGATSGDPSVLSNDPAYLGREHFARADYGAAEAKFRAAVEQAPGDVASWLGLAASYDHLGRFELADRAYMQATKLAGSTFEVLNNRGFSYLLRGDSRRAAALLQQARSLRPDDPVLANNLILLRDTRT